MTKKEIRNEIHSIRLASDPLLADYIEPETKQQRSKEQMSKAIDTSPAISGAAFEAPLESNWVDEVGGPAWRSIVAMVTTLKCDYDRLEELREQEKDWEPDEDMPTFMTWALADPYCAEEMRELIAAADDCESQDDALQRIHEDALSVEVRSDWHSTSDGEGALTEFRILLATGGPAVQIRGELDERAEPSRAWLEVQDCGKPWTRYFKADEETLLTYARQFCFT